MKTLKLITATLLFFILVGIFIFFISIAITNFFCSLQIISIVDAFIISIVASLIISAIVTALYMKYKLAKKFDKFIFRFSKNSITKGSILLLTFLYIITFSYCLENAKMDFGNIKSLLNTEWIIFGISISLFLFWHKNTYENFIKTLPEKPTLNNAKEISTNIKKRKAYSLKLNISDSILIFFFLNCVWLMATTNIVYIQFENNMFLNKFYVIFGFYISIATMSQFLMFIFSDFYIKRLQLALKTQISMQEAQTEYNKNKVCTIIDCVLNSDKTTAEFGDEKRDKIKEYFLDILFHENAENDETAEAKSSENEKPSQT